MPNACSTGLPILYSFRRCPYAMRARMALHVSGIEVETREVVLRDKPDAMLEVSPKGTVPVLLLPDDAVLEESRDIMHWALKRSDPEHWLVGADAQLVDTIDGPFKHHLDRYKYATRYDSDPDEHRAAATAILENMNERLARNPYLTGTRRAFADIATFPFIRQFANSDRTWFDAQPMPNLQRWLADLLGSALFKEIMVKRPQWKPDAA